MSLAQKIISQNAEKSDRIARDEARVLWIAIFHAVVMIKVAIAKYLKLDDRCEHCGNKL
jgi:hypothetical protein